THDACERIAKEEKMIFGIPKIYTNDFDFNDKKHKIIKKQFSVAMLGDVWVKGKETETIWTTGEASADNCKNTYYWAMCEKRLKDRLTLKRIGAYEHGIYSDVESDFEEDTPEFSREFVFKFGKHKGKMIKDVPVGYLEYFLQDDKEGWMKDFAEQELKARAEETPKAYEDEITTPTHLAIDALLNVPSMPIKAVEKTNQFLKEKPTEKAALKRLAELKTVLDQIENK
ncbi:MAG: hypothetical protein KAS32_15120, partial [Candidatus Peribacteraceae bacterium]|nr:hypothetical protein [Candidatus Peribacteraceae bacterium]